MPELDVYEEEGVDRRCVRAPRAIAAWIWSRGRGCARVVWACVIVCAWACEFFGVSRARGGCGGAPRACGGLCVWRACRVCAGAACALVCARCVGVFRVCVCVCARMRVCVRVSVCVPVLSRCATRAASSMTWAPRSGARRRRRSPSATSRHAPALGVGQSLCVCAFVVTGGGGDAGGARRAAWGRRGARF